MQLQEKNTTYKNALKEQNIEKLEKRREKKL